MRNLLVLVLFLIFVFVFFMPHHSHHKSPEFLIQSEVNEKMAEDFRVYIESLGDTEQGIVRIESNGGLVTAMNKIVYYLHKYPAKHLTCVVDLKAYSAAALITMHCPVREIAPRASFIFHSYRVCQDDGCTKVRAVNPLDGISYAESTEDLQVVKPYLTAAEWTTILSGENVTISGRDLLQRLGKGHG